MYPHKWATLFGQCQQRRSDMTETYRPYPCPQQFQICSSASRIFNNNSRQAIGLRRTGRQKQASSWRACQNVMQRSRDFEAHTEAAALFRHLAMYCVSLRWRLKTRSSADSAMLCQPAPARRTAKALTGRQDTPPETTRHAGCSGCGGAPLLADEVVRGMDGSAPCRRWRMLCRGRSRE